MTIGALAPYFGCKRAMADDIVSLFPPHKGYFSACTGSMADLFAKEPASLEIVNDLYGDIINLARVVQTCGEELFARSIRTVVCEELFDEAVARLQIEHTPFESPALDMQRAYDFLVVEWQGINGFTGTRRKKRTFAKRMTSGGGSPSTRWRHVVESIPWWFDRLRNVVIHNEDAFDMLATIEDSKANVIYCDPPYVEEGTDYIHPFDESKHIRLASLLRGFSESSVFVSYRSHSLVTRLYEGWTCVPIVADRRLSAGSQRGEREIRSANEIVLTNKPLGIGKANGRKPFIVGGADDGQA